MNQYVELRSSTLFDEILSCNGYFTVVNIDHDDTDKRWIDIYRFS